MHWLFQPSHKQNIVESDIPQWIEEGTPRLDHCPQAGVGTLLIRASAPQCCLHEEEIAMKVLLKSTGRAVEEMAPEHPSMRTLIGTTNDTILQVTEQVYQGEWTLAPNLLSCQQNKDCMRELQQELNKCMARAGLHGAPHLAGSSRSRRCSHGCSASQTQSPSAELQRREAVKWPRKESLIGWSRSQKWCSQSRGRSRSRWHQSPSPEHLGQSQSPSPSPPRSSPTGEWLCLHMKGLKLQSRTWESRSRTWQSRAPTLVEERPKRQVRFNIDDELGSEPTLPPDVTLFLAKGETVEWLNAPISATTGPMDAPQPIPREGPQWSSTPIRGARPKVPAWPSTAQSQ